MNQPLNNRALQAGAVARPWDFYSGRQRWIYLFVLFLVSTSSVVDRQVITVLLEPIKTEFGVSDTMLGLLTGLSFAAFYVTLGIPIARLADRYNRKVILGVSLTIWSLLTALCGVSQSFVQLVLVRIGVGAGEAGAVPPAQSLLADYFPPEKRSLALAIFFLSSAAGNGLGLIVGGQIAEAYGWRLTFVAFGLPSLLLVLLTTFVLHEPRNLPQFRIQAENKESFIEVLRELRRKKSFVNSAIGMVLYYTMIYGVIAFMVSFIMRTQGLGVADASKYYGGIALLASLVGNPLGGWISDKLGAKNPAWLARIPGYGFLLALPLFFGSYLSTSLASVLICFGIGMAVMMAAAPPIFSCLHAVCGSARRATAIAIALLFANLMGVGMGPVLAGGLSDLFATTHGEAEGLRLSLCVMNLLYLPSAYFMLQASRTIASEVED